MLKVYNERCKNCLLSDDRIVSPARAGEVLKETVQRGSFFICHKASIRGEEVCCRGYFDEVGDRSGHIRVAVRLDAIEFVELPDDRRLTSWNEQNENRQ